ncbi:MAG: LLM class flavin-dependent oxidoreductase [Rhodospirillaceae bacterium]|jgi:limonene 1,2-monooxygenase|nr:LLM class flavin-dependent oxidoreductase [Rhodospirillaceae bacterium]MBT5455272.1 LLM class flavin-dependent oxidoreductase [Rhodospirillaceae bacterium]
MSDVQTRFGVFLAPFHALNENPTLMFERDLELIMLLDRLGYEEAWIGEHHSGGFETIAAPEVFIAAAARETRHIRLGTGVRSLPYTHPFMLADSMVQLDHMTRGRAMFGVGPGALPSDAAQMGIDARQSRRMMEEAIDVIIPLLEGKRVSAETDWFTLNDAKLQHASFTRPRMEMAVTSVRSPAGALLAGRYGLGLLSLGGQSDEALAAYAKNWALYEETAAANGQIADRGKFRIAAQMHISDTREQALKDIKFGVEEWGRYARDVLPLGPVPKDVENVADFIVESRRAIVGTPDDAIREIELMQEGSGGFGVVMFMCHDWADWEATRRSYELFARHVIPHFQGQFEGRRESYTAAAARQPEFRSAAADGVANATEKYESGKS